MKVVHHKITTEPHKEHCRLACVKTSAADQRLLRTGDTVLCIQTVFGLKAFSEQIILAWIFKKKKSNSMTFRHFNCDLESKQWHDIFENELKIEQLKYH